MFQATVLKFDDLLGGLKFATNAKFQQNIPKFMPARPKKGTRGVNTTVITLCRKLSPNYFF